MGVSFFEADFINPDGLLQLLVRFAFNFIVTLILVRFLYYQNARRKDYLFTFLLISTIVFLLCILLDNVNLQLGFALGLFAIFGIIRYRTTQIPIKEMTYLFITIGISVINALSGDKVSLMELFATNFLVVAVTFGLERVWLLKHESSKLIIYEKIELITPERYDEMIDDLRERTGLDIHRAEVGRINFLRDTAEIIIYYYNSEMSNVTTYDSNDDDD
ncbi:DUF4956 domain-containing protein [Carboxylicivirga sediminis]|uniref:DUF4956 domain-containing protein n=1 Tax=Carboxylicivirga sediminis TaxID=2006564 RepID=A0A941IY32_9BACT|nr:DUF4956 domain-containing protein [Carboxylicivirga sediminis]MBR8536069.1 DUF4956 domain-containing protein [Carboxylicivirga sediminis]